MRFVDLAGSLGVPCDLRPEFIKAGELLFGAQIVEKGNFNVQSVDISIKVEKMQLQEAFSGLIAEGGAHSDVGDSAESGLVVPRLHSIDAIWRKLLIVGSEICGGKP
jgi:hypothetical protein